MMIIGCDLHTRYQQIAMLDTETGEEVERRLEHESGEARAFYLALRGPVRVGIEGGWPKVAQALISLASATQRVPRLSRSLRRAGTTNASSGAAYAARSRNEISVHPSFTRAGPGSSKR